MKKKKIFSILIGAVLFLFGCSESFLDKLPEDTLSPGVFFGNPDDIKTGLVATYKPLQDIFAYNALPWLLGQMSDDGTRAFSYTVQNTFNKTNGNSELGLWNDFYKIIVNANNIISIIDNFFETNESISPQDEMVLNAYQGEARFLRALSYFYLVRLWGDVPAFTDSWKDPGDAFGIGRTPVNQVLNSIVIPDLEFAAANCFQKGDSEIASEGARATKGAALTILGEVYLTQKDYENAAAELKKLIVEKKAGNYKLLDDFSQIWLPSNKFNSESVFEVNYNVGAGMPSWYFRNMTNTTGYSIYDISTNGMYTITKDCMDDFYEHEEWIRYRVSADSAWTPLNGLYQPFPLKLMPPPEDGLKQYDNTGTDYNFMITRYADALLMYAEALMGMNKKEEAASYVNMVRARVDMAPVTADGLDIYRILHERRMELAFEGHRYLDLKRTGKVIEIISPKLMGSNDYENRIFRSSPIPEYQLILPIPIGEIQKDETLTQNPGY